MPKLVIQATITFDGPNVEAQPSNKDEAENLLDIIKDALGYPETLEIGVTVHDVTVVHSVKVENNE